ncbi:dihydrofolate reductase family protein, partial [Bacillus sp. WP8]|uniref:dihydrofolate reductase family protein n=1 Tax=Bacillus sp. WP8 TaxID=756828 RepID=UPI0016431513
VTAETAATWIFRTKEADEEKGGGLEEGGVGVFMRERERGVAVEEVVEVVGEKNMCSVMIEGGGEINGCLLEQQVVDKLVMYMG